MRPSGTAAAIEAVSSPRICASIGVAIEPGASAFTVMPSGADSRAATFIIASTAPFDAL
jgi:hypothetical protein